MTLYCSVSSVQLVDLPPEGAAVGQASAATSGLQYEQEGKDIRDQRMYMYASQTGHSSAYTYGAQNSVALVAQDDGGSVAEHGGDGVAACL